MAPSIPDTVQNILNFGLDLTHQECLSTDTFPKHSPIKFQDKHLDDNYILKQVVSLPGTELLTGLLNFANELLESVDEFPKPSLPALVTHRYPAVDLNADTIAKYYQNSISEACCYLASHLFLHSKATSWCNELSWRQSGDSEVRPFPRDWNRARVERRLSEEYFVAHKWSLVHIRDSPSVPIDSLTPVEQNSRKYLSNCSEWQTELAVWEVFACTVASDYLFDSIRNIARKSTEEKMIFLWNRPHTKEFNIKHMPYKRYSDAIPTLWTLPHDSLNFDEQGAECPEASECNEGTSQRRPRTQPIDIRPLDSMDRENVEIENNPSDIAVWGQDYLQRAWARAVDIDATFIILHRGTTEIICIRHRASQTLFVSEIIDTSVKYYGKLQIALYAAILKDRVERQEIWEREHPSKSNVTSQKKRSFDQVEPETHSCSRKRLRSNSLSLDSSQAAPISTLSLKERCKKLELAIVNLDYSWHRSTIPSMFVRRNFDGRAYLRPLSLRPSYPLESCLRINVKSWIGGGASGHAHRGILYIGSDDKRCEDVVVKFGRDDHSRQSMRHESKVYEYLAQAKVKSVPHFYGLFEDIENKDSPYILVTSYAGESLAVSWKRGRAMIPKSQHPTYLRSLAEIHAAGIHHRDLRAPNVVIDKDGKVTLIDFDIARLYVTGRQRKHERKRMLNLLNGKSVDYDRTSFRDGFHCDDCSPGICHEASGWDSEEEEVVRARSEPPHIKN
ncbi:hypothetical protein EV359DRAFT_81551 [Lentinula novae-zelandiae]|nr:hypothetical protein EV359DRAFT_81551 [Lentinula novae-zelandiae]